MLYVKEINSKQEAIELGKDRGWCTADPESKDYETYYGKDRGKLFAIYKEGKQKPQYQIFIDNEYGGVELREKFNKYINTQNFFKNEGKSLNEWFNSIIEEIKPKVIRSRIKKQANMFGEINYSEDPIDNKRFEFKLNFQERLIELIHNVDELPPADIVSSGTVFKLILEKCLVFAIKKEYGHKEYLTVPLQDTNSEYFYDGTTFRTITVKETLENIRYLAKMCTNVQERNFMVYQKEAFVPSNYDEPLEIRDLSVETIRVPISGKFNYRMA